MKSRVGLHVLGIAGMILGTWVIGWTAVPIVALACGLASIAPRNVAVYAGVAWTVLMIADFTYAAFARLAAMLGGVMGIPAAFLILLTIVFPMILGWSAATVGIALRSIRPRVAPPV